jgi:DNA-binding transcriptional MerR regulator
MYTIRQASLRSGVSVPLIRAWERRYGVVDPERTASGYRLYDDRAIATLATMRWLVDDGWQPSTAAAAIRDGSAPAADAAPPRVAPEEESLSVRFVEAAARYDGRAIEAVLDEMLARGSFEAAVDRYLLPAAVALGDAWSRGEMDVAAEHAASAAVMRRLSAAFDAAALAAQGPPVVVGLPPGVRHELGALAFATALRRRGVKVVYLGPDVPIGSWVHAVQASGAAAAVIGAVMPADAAAAANVVAALRTADGSLRIAVGGTAAALVAAENVTVLPESIAESARVAERLLS